MALQRVSLQRVVLQRVALQRVAIQRVPLQRVDLQRVALQSAGSDGRTEGLLFSEAVFNLIHQTFKDRGIG